MKSLSEFSNHYTILCKQLISAIEQTYNDVHGNDNCTEHIFDEHNQFYMYFCESEVATAVLVESLVKDEDGQILVSGCVPNFSTTEKDMWNLNCFDVSCLINLLEELKTDIKQRKIDYIKNYIINKGAFRLPNPATASSGIKIDKPCVRHFNGETSIVENGNDAGINIYAFPDEVIDSIYREAKSKDIDISLTEKQKAVLEKFYDALKELGDAGIGMVHERDSNRVQFYNASNVAEINSCDTSIDLSREPGWINVQVKFDKCPSREMCYYYYKDGGEQVIVRPKC